MRQKSTAAPVPLPASPAEPIRVIYERPRPRIAKGLLVLLLAGPVGLLIFAMGQTVWGALWRAWLTMIVLYVVLTVIVF